ncbi:carbon-nitrogen hydrolase family protein [[Clostridium] symbiosum]|nr:nitrilase-related carbon-nitrogen hydrolase [[Clostridium] symbiosum]
MGLIQMDLAFLDKETNLRKASEMVREAAANGASLICLPEAFNTGYLGSDIPAMKKMAEPLDGESVTVMRKLAAELSVYLAAPIIYAAANGEAENTAVLINDEGEIEGTYSKSHPVGDERTYFQRGNEYPVWNTKLGKIGIVICYDVCFPETSRILALRGAELMLVPSAWRASHYFKEWWDLNLACRAIDNLLYVAAVNRCGQSGEEIFAGKSQVISPIGEVLAAFDVEEEGILYQEIDLERVAKEREFNTVLTDRHPEDYKILSDR